MVKPKAKRPLFRIEVYGRGRVMTFGPGGKVTKIEYEKVPPRIVNIDPDACPTCAKKGMAGRECAECVRQRQDEAREG